MIKVGNQVSLFHNMGLVGTVIKMTKRPVKQWSTSGSPSHTWDVHIKWNNGDIGVYKYGDVMRID